MRNVTSITLTITDPDTFDVLCQQQFDLNPGNGPLAAAIAMAEACDARDAYLKEQGWTLDTSLPVDGGMAGDASTAMGEMVDWSILGDR